MITGLISGMFGIGGSVVATPLLILFVGIATNFAVSSPLPAVILSALAGSITYNTKGIIKKNIVLYTLITGIPFGMLGSYINNVFDVQLIVIAKALVLLALSLKYLFRSTELKSPISFKNERNILLLTGVIGGFIAGFVAIGGGIVYVTAYSQILKKNMTISSANSLVAVGITAIFNALQHYYNGNIDIILSLYLAIGIVPMAIIGAKLNMISKNRTLELSFGIIMLLFSLFFIISRFAI